MYSRALVWRRGRVEALRVLCDPQRSRHVLARASAIGMCRVCGGVLRAPFGFVVCGRVAVSLQSVRKEGARAFSVSKKMVQKL